MTNMLYTNGFGVNRVIREKGLEIYVVRKY